MNNSTNSKKYLTKIENYPTSKEFDEDIIILMSLNRFGYKDIEKKRKELIDKYSAYYNSNGAKQRLLNYTRFDEDGYVANFGRRSYETSAPGKLDKMISILNMPITNRQKIYQMSEIFLTPKDFFDRYKDLYPMFMNTDRMKNFADVYYFLNENENNLEYDKLNYMRSIKSDLELYPEALKVLNKYINKNTYPLTTFLKKEKLSLYTFNNYMEVIKLLRPALYNEANEKRGDDRELSIQKQKERFFANCSTISTIANEIIEANNSGMDYDLLEFYKKVPFKNSNVFFIAELLDFTYKNLPKYSSTIANYVYTHKLNTRTKIIPIDYKSINNPNCLTIINDVVFDKELDLKLVDYLNNNDYPACENTLRIVRRKYANGELVMDSDQVVVKKLVKEDQ